MRKTSQPAPQPARPDIRVADGVAAHVVQHGFSHNFGHPLVVAETVTVAVQHQAQAGQELVPALDVTKGLTVTQSTTPGNPATNTNVFKRDVKLTEEAGRFRVSIEGVAGDDLDLFLLYDANRNGQFEYPTESVAASTSPIHIESVEVPGFPKLGDYQVWVEGWGLADRTKATTFDLTIDIVKGNSIVLRNAPSGLVAGRAENVDVCAELATLEGQPGPASGLLIFGPGGAPQMFQIPVTWHRTLPRQIWLPVTAQRDADVVGRGGP